MSPQLPEPVRSTMQALTDGLLSVLGGRLVGVYLGGSAARGDFCEPSSDLDFLVVTGGDLSMEDLLAVELVHRDLLAQFPYAARLEGDYAPQALLVPQGTLAPVPGCERGVFLPRVGEIMLTADAICDMRECGIPVYGPDPREVLPAVSPEQVRSAVRKMLAQGPDACETPVETAAAVLNLVRSVCALDMGKPVTKSEGAAWAISHLDPVWRPAIRAALVVRSGRGTPGDTQLLKCVLPELDRQLRTLCTRAS